MKRIGIIGAMEVEVANLKQAMKNEKIIRKASVEFYEGEIAGKEVVIARSGVGKVNAAICAQIMIDLFGIDILLNTGIAGSLSAQIDIGDIVLSTDVLHHDMDAVGFGYPRGQIPQMQEFSFPADAALRSLAEEVCCRVNPDIRVHQGRIVSGDQFVSDQKVKEDIVHTFGGFAVEMDCVPVRLVPAICRQPKDVVTPDMLPSLVMVTYTQRLKVTSSVIVVPFTSSIRQTVAFTLKLTG